MKTFQSISTFVSLLLISLSQACDPGQYLDPDTLNCKPCMANCESCTTLEVCDLCISNFFFDKQAGICTSSCPEDTYENTDARTCDPRLSIKSITPKGSLCSDLEFEAVVSPLEASTVTSFTWTFTSVPVDIQMKDQLTTYLASKTTSHLIVPKSLLEAFASYTFTCSYQDASSNTVTASTDTYDYTPYFESNSLQQYAESRNLETVIKIRLIQDPCLGFVPEYNVLWTQTGGPSINLNDFIDPDFKLYLRFPPCSLATGTYDFECRVELADNPSVGLSLAVRYVVHPELYTVEIEDKNRNHHVDEDLNIKATVKLTPECSDSVIGNVDYEWSCLEASTGGTYVDCDDPSNIFGQTYATGELVVPSSYFAEGDIIRIGLKVKALGTETNVNSIYSITKADTPIFRLSYIPSDHFNPFEIFIPEREFMLQAELIQTSETYAYALKWFSTPSVFYTTERAKIKFKGSVPITSSWLQVTLLITYAGKSISLYGDYPILQAPGIIEQAQYKLDSTPSRGDSLTTVYQLKTSGFLPYREIQFSYSYDQVNWYMLSEPQNSDTYYTILPGSSLSSHAIVKATAMNYYGSKVSVSSKVMVNNKSRSASQLLTILPTFLKGLSQIHPVEDLRMISIIFGELYAVENRLLEPVNNPKTKPTCNGRGVYDSERGLCQCNVGWALEDCSLSALVYDNILSQKINMLNHVETLWRSIIKVLTKGCSQAVYLDCLEGKSDENLRYLMTYILDILELATNNIPFTNQTIFANIENILENTLYVTYTANRMPVEHAKRITKLVDKEFSYFRYSDCGCTTQHCSSFIEKSIKLLDGVSSSGLRNLWVAETPLEFETQTLNVITAKAAKCSMEKLVITGDLFTTQIEFIVKDQTNCDQVIDIQAYLFVDIFDCDIYYGRLLQNKELKSKLLITLLDDQTKQPITQGIYLNLQMPPNQDCPQSCTVARAFSSPWGRQYHCHCHDLAALIPSIGIRMTLLPPIDKYEWNWKESPIPWVIIGDVAWLFLTIGLSLTVLKDFCLFEKLKNRGEGCYIMMTYLASQKFMSIYLFKNSDLPRVTRTFLYFVRILVYAFFSSVFAMPSKDNDVGDSFVELSTGVFFVPYFATVPLIMVLEYTISDTRPIKRGKSKLLITKRIIAFIVFATVVSGSIVGMLAIPASKDRDDESSWVVSFFIVLITISEFIFLPVLTIVCQYCLGKAVADNNIKYKHVGFLLDRTLMDVFGITIRKQSEVYAPQRQRQATSGEKIKKKKTAKISPLDATINTTQNNLISFSQDMTEIHETSWMDHTPQKSKDDNDSTPNERNVMPATQKTDSQPNLDNLIKEINEAMSKE